MRIRKHLRNIFWGSYEDSFNLPLKRVKNKWMAGERCIENPYVHRKIVKIGMDLQKERKNITILDVGCARSTLPIELANMGYDVTGIDYRDYSLKHPNLKFIKGDFTSGLVWGFVQSDIVLCVSTYEHVGTGAYHKGNIVDIQYFRKALMYSVAEGGYLIITVPLKTEKKGFQRYIEVEEIESLGEVVDSFFWKNLGCFTIKKG